MLLNICYKPLDDRLNFILGKDNEDYILENNKNLSIMMLFI